MKNQGSSTPAHSFMPWTICIVLIFCVATCIASTAQTFTTLAELSATTGRKPFSSLVQGLDGNLYGTASASGKYGFGTFFQMTPTGTVTTLYNFCRNDVSACPDGAVPYGDVALGSDGNFYGTTLGAGPARNSFGTIYKMTPAGSITTLHTFCSLPKCADGESATTGLTLAQNLSFYGIAGPGEDMARVFQIGSSGTFKTILRVCPGQVCPTDAGPTDALFQADGGYLIGPGPGGAFNAGAIYRITPQGLPTIIYSFCDDSTCHDGLEDEIRGHLVQAASGLIFGTTFGGGSVDCRGSGVGCGTAFRVTAAGGGALAKLHDFCSLPVCHDGTAPGPLIQATDGSFYGGTQTGGGGNNGTLFKLTPSGKFSVIWGFEGTGGNGPITALLQTTDGNLYGTTSGGGVHNGGIIFRLSLGLTPFVKIVQPAGKVGDSIIILGDNLIGSTNVAFNGTSAAFTVVSDTEIIAAVPIGASTGKIRVVTPSTTLSSNVVFPIIK